MEQCAFGRPGRLRIAGGAGNPLPCKCVAITDSGLRIMISSIQIAILKAIQANDGKLSWYQLNRELTQRLASGGSTAVSEVLMPGLRELEQADFITTVAGHHPAQPL